MKLCHKGIDWIGVDKSALASHCPYLGKMGWFVTADSCKDAKELLVNLTKALSSELLSSNLAANFYLGELTVPANKKKNKLNVVLIILERKVVIDATTESDDEEDGAVAIRTAEPNPSSLFAAPLGGGCGCCAVCSVAFALLCCAWSGLRLMCCLLCGACLAVHCYCMTAGWGATEVFRMLRPSAVRCAASQTC